MEHFLIRTDLALESKEHLEGEKNELRGVAFEEKIEELAHAKPSRSKPSKTGVVVKGICDNEYITSAQISKLDLGKGCAEIEAILSGELIYKIIEEKTAIKIENEQALVEQFEELTLIKKKYDKISAAWEQVQATGYGVVTPSCPMV